MPPRGRLSRFARRRSAVALSAVLIFVGGVSARAVPGIDLPAKPDGPSPASESALAAISGDPISPLGDPIVLDGTTGGEAFGGKPAIAGDGTNFLVAWRENSSHVRASRVDHAGNVLDPGGIAVMVTPQTSGFPAVGFDGTNFIVFFSHIPAGEGIWELYAVRVAPDGTVLDPGGVRITNTGVGLRPFRMLGVAFDGTNHLVAWRSNNSDVYATRVSPALVNLDGTHGALVSGNHASWYPAAGFDGTNFMVTWHDGRAAPYDIYGARVTSTGTVIDPGGFLIASGPGHMDANGMAFDGTNYLVAWRDFRSNPTPGTVWVYGTRVTPDAVVLDDPPILIADNQWGGVIPVAVASDGDGFLVAWTATGFAGDFRGAEVFAREVSGDGTLVGDAAIPVGVGIWHQAQPTIGYDAGHFLVAHGSLQDDAVARLLARQPAPPPATGTPGGPVAAGWTTEASPTAGGHWHDVHALAADHAYAVGFVPWPGSGNRNLVRDNGGWTVAYEPVNGSYGMWASAPDDVWSAGWCGSLFHYDGATWARTNGCYQHDNPDTRIVENVWGDGEGVLFGASNQGLIVEIDSNQRWQVAAQIVPNDLWDVWGSWRDDVWMVGANATVVHFDGLTWERRASIPTVQSINGVHGSDPTNVWAVGDHGTILEWNGSSWIAHASGTLEHLWDVWALAPDDVYAVGEVGTILHYDGTSWITEISGTSQDLLGVSAIRDPGAGVTAVWATGNDVLLRTEHDLAVDPVGLDDRYVVDEDSVLSVPATTGALANDTDPEGDTLAATVFEPPRLGTLTLQPDGAFTYTPDADVDGIDAFWYEVTDGGTGFDRVRVVIEIVPQNESPVAHDDGPYYTWRGGGPMQSPNGELLANDTDDEGDPLTAHLHTAPSHGTVNLQPDGTFDYSHDGSPTNADSFTYRTFDGTSYSAPATVTWVIADPPPGTGQWIHNPTTGHYYALTQPMSFQDAEDQAQAWGGHLATIDAAAEEEWLYVTFGVGAWIGFNDIDVEGSWEWTSGDAVAYTAWCTGEPDNHLGNEDAAAMSSGPTGMGLCWSDLPADGHLQGIVEAATPPPNIAPVAVADDYLAVRGETKHVDVLEGLLANDSDADGDSLTAHHVSGPDHGTVTVDTDGSFTYTHDSSPAGSDSFTYRAHDGEADSTLATVTWTIGAPAPSTGVWLHNPATGHHYGLGDWLTFADAEQQAAGWGGHVVTVDDAAEELWLWSHFGWSQPIGFNDLASEGDWVWSSGAPVTYTNWCDGEPNDYLGEDVAVLSHWTSGVDLCWNDVGDGERHHIVELTTPPPVNQAPVAVDDSITIGVGATYHGNVLGNDHDPDGDPLTAIHLAGPAHGSLSLASDGSFTYTNDGSAATSDSFMYEVFDGQLYSNAATVDIEVVASQPPVPPLASVVPARLLETRVGSQFTTVDGDFEGIGRQTAGSTIELLVAGRGGVATNADAVMLNVTAVFPSGPGFLTVYPCGEPIPQASNVNYLGGEVAPNAVLSKIGTNGTVCIYTLTNTDIIADVAGYVPDGGAPSTVVPARLLETRVGSQFTTIDSDFEGIGRQTAGSTIELVVTGRGGVATNADAVMLNVTAVFPSGPGFLTVYPCGEPIPQASNVNYLGGEVAPNAVLSKIGTNGTVCIYTLTNTDIIADVAGYV